MVHCWDAVWGGTFIKLNELFPENELFDFIARWNVEYCQAENAHTRILMIIIIVNHLLPATQ